MIPLRLRLLQSIENFSHRGYFGRKSKNKELEPKGPPQAAERSEPKWAHFCDFREITHIVVKDCRVSIHRQDNKCLVSGTWSLPAAPPAGSVHVGARSCASETGRRRRWKGEGSFPGFTPASESFTFSSPTLAEG